MCIRDSERNGQHDCDEASDIGGPVGARGDKVATAQLLTNQKTDVDGKAEHHDIGDDVDPVSRHTRLPLVMVTAMALVALAVTVATAALVALAVAVATAALMVFAVAVAAAAALVVLAVAVAMVVTAAAIALIVVLVLGRVKRPIQTRGDGFGLLLVQQGDGLGAHAAAADGVEHVIQGERGIGTCLLYTSRCV